MTIRRAIVVTACGAAILLAGCSGDNRADPPSVPSASPTQSPGSVGKLIDAGVLAAQQGKSDEAKGDFEQAVKADPHSKVAWFNLGFLAHSHGQLADALKNYDKALECDPSYTPAMSIKAILLEVGKPDEAIALYQRILAINDKASTTLIRLGFLLDKKGDPNAARTAFAGAMNLDPALATAVPAAYSGKPAS